MIIFKLLISIVLLFILPILIGSSLCDVISFDKSVERCLIYGVVAMWALCQLIALPIILLKQSFLLLVMILSVLYAISVIYGLKYKSFIYLIPKISFKKYINKYRLSEVIGVILFCVSLISVLLLSIYLQHTDADDARFCVNIVDIIRTHRMFLTNPATGEFLGTWEGEVARDVISPWAVFVAYCSYITHIHPTIMFHTIIPIAIYIYIYVVYWMISGKIIENIAYRGLFVFLLTLLNIYGCASRYVAETRVMVRVWQGKTVVSGLCIPLLIFMFIEIYEKDVDKRKLVLLLLLEMAMCLLSGMGILIGAIMVGGYGLVYAVVKKDWKISLKMWTTALPCVIYYVVSLIV